MNDFKLYRNNYRILDIRKDWWLECGYRRHTTQFIDNSGEELFGQKIFRLWTFLPPSIWQSYIWRFEAGQSLT